MSGLILDAILLFGSLGMGAYGLYEWIYLNQRNSLVWCLAAVITIGGLILNSTALPYLSEIGDTTVVLYLSNVIDFLIVASWAFAVYRDGFNR